eukprot:scaffold4730_cov109-Isochrysis_galbana.AAC.1
MPRHFTTGRGGALCPNEYTSSWHATVAARGDGGDGGGRGGRAARSTLRAIRGGGCGAGSRAN